MRWRRCRVHTATSSIARTTTNAAPRRSPPSTTSPSAWCAPDCTTPPASCCTRCATRTHALERSQLLADRLAQLLERGAELVTRPTRQVILELVEQPVRKRVLTGGVCGPGDRAQVA